MVAFEITGTVDIAPMSDIEPLEVTIRLEDTTMLDGPSQTVAEARCKVNPDSGVSTPFSLSVADEDVRPRRRYTLSARGDVPGRTDIPRFGTVESYPWSADSDQTHRLELRKLN